MDELVFPTTPSGGLNTDWYQARWPVSAGWFDDAGHTFIATYTRKKKQLPAAPRLGITLHSSGGYTSFLKQPDGPFTGCDIEVRTQDGQAKKGASEWWCYGADGMPYPVRRVVRLFEVVTSLYPQVDLDNKGIVYRGSSMGNGGILHTLLLPDQWRNKVAYCMGQVPVCMPRQVAALNPGQYKGWPADDGTHDAMWAAADFLNYAPSDPVVRGMHYRMAFSSDDWFSEGLHNGVRVNTQLVWLQACAEAKISVVATWVKKGHSSRETGVKLPVIAGMVSGQDVTLDRAHPCFTNSTGNWPAKTADITDRATYPRGHYNLGLTWTHAGIVDTATEMILPIKYKATTGIGAGVPDQPLSITVDVTPRRPKNFRLLDGEVLRWSCGGQSGAAVVRGDAVTAVGVELTSGAAAKVLRFWR